MAIGFFGSALPIVSSISPGSGPTAGETFVNISGSNFLGATSATIGGIAITGLTVVNSTTITGYTGPNSVGTDNVAVTTSAGIGTSSNPLYTYTSAVIPSPVVTSINPPNGPTAGGTFVTIGGQYFTGAYYVTIGGVAITELTVVNAATITGYTGAHIAGTANVIVYKPDDYGVGSNLFTYGALPSPVVSSISPSSGPTAGGTFVTVYGSNFVGTDYTYIGGIAITGLSVAGDGLSLSGYTGAHGTGTVDVQVHRSDNQFGIGSNLFTYSNSPLIPSVTSISPSSGTTAGGTFVTIGGSHFTGATRANIGGVDLTSLSIVSDSSITGITGANSAGVGEAVAVVAPAGTGVGFSLFTYTASPPPSPVVSSISPPSGTINGGTPVTIYGSHFTGTSGVSIGGVDLASFSVVNDTTITGYTGAHSVGDGAAVTVISSAGTGVGYGLFSYIVPSPPSPPPPPVVSAIVPSNGSITGGTPVTIYGANFTGATSAIVGGVTLTSFSFGSDSVVYGVTGPHGAGIVDVVVYNSSGPGTGYSLFTYSAPPPPPPPPGSTPIVSSVNPPTGLTTGGTPVVIGGQNFTGATSASIGDVPITSFARVSDSSVKGITGPTIAGPQNVSVTTPAGTGSSIKFVSTFPPLYVPGKRVSVVAIGASVAYGLGLDQTQNYYALMQAQVDATLSSHKGGWTARYIHQDDIQPGNINYYSGGNVFAPFNGTATLSDGTTPNLPNFGNGNYAGGGSLKNLNPQDGIFNVIPATVGTSKLTIITTGLNAGARGIFNIFGGFQTLPSSSTGSYTPPGISLTHINQNIRLCVDVCTYLSVGFIGTGTANVYTNWGPIDPRTGSGYAWPLSGGTTSGITLRTIQFGWSSTTTFGIYQPVIGPDNLSIFQSRISNNTNNIPATSPPATTSAWTYVGPISASNNANGVQTMAIYWASGTIDISGLWPGRLQTTEDLIFQICARDSFCLQDYVGTDLPSPPGTGATIATLIQQGVINQPPYGPSDPSGPPTFIVGDMYNSMITGDACGVGGINCSGDRRLAPAAYAAKLVELGTALQSGAFAAAKIIIVMPIVPNLKLFSVFGIVNGGIAWLAWQPSYGGVNWGGVSGGGSVDLIVDAYRSAISTAVFTHNDTYGTTWEYLDLTAITGKTGTASMSNFYQADGLHPTPEGASAIANYMIAAFTL